MIVASLLDAGADLDTLKQEIAKLDLTGYTIECEQVTRGGIGGTQFSVQLDNEDQPRRNLSDILELLEHSGLSSRVTEQTTQIFTKLARAEAKVHRIDVDRVHFHEVGAIDSIIDIAAACIALELLRVEKVLCSPIPLGSGTVECSHGTLPVPAPATAELLTGARTKQTELTDELTTPTAAAILTTLSESYGPIPAMNIKSIGYGAGKREGKDLPNLLRVFVGELSQSGAIDSVVEVSANVDDCTGELIAATIDKLLSAGSLDAWSTPIFMKKSRPAWTISALCSMGDVETVERIIFSETTTFGVRRSICGRTKLQPRHETVETPYGAIRIKIGTLSGQDITASPEFSDTVAAAQAHGVPVRKVMQSAVDAYDKEI